MPRAIPLTNRSRRPSRRLLVPAALLAAAVAVAGGPETFAEDADDRFAIAAGLFDREQWELATKEFRGFIEAHPEHPKADQAMFFLGETLLQTGRTEEARSYFRTYLSRRPDGAYAAQALFRSGEAAYLLNQPEQARAAMEKFRSKYPDDPAGAYVLPYLGDLALGRGDAAEAERCFREGLSKYPQGPLQDDCRFGLARALQSRGKPAEAERLYAAVAAKRASPVADDAHFHLGALQFATRRYEEAVATFAALEKEFPQSRWVPRAVLGRGWALVKLGRRDEAKPLFTRLVSDADVGLEARFWLGLMQKAEGDYATAAATLLQAAKANPDGELAPEIRFHAGDALLEAGDTDAALEQFHRVARHDGGDHPWADDAQWGKVRVALKVGDHEAVDREAAEFQRRFAESPLKTEVQRMLARSCLECKDYQAAARRLEPLVAAGGEGEDALEDRYLLALAYEGLQRHEDALAALRPVLDAATGKLKADAQLRQGALLVALGRYGDAVAPLQAFLATNPTGEAAVQGRGELAICLARSGKLDQAKAQFAELLRTHGDHALLPAVIEQLAEAAYDAEDSAWAQDLFRRLSSAGRGEDDTQKPGALLGLAWSQFQAGRLAEAAATFGQVLEKDPPKAVKAEAGLTRGRILQRLGQPDGALAMFDLVVEQCPETPQHAEAMFAAARARDQLDQDRQAIALYERLATQYPDFEHRDAVLYQWAWALRDVGSGKEAETIFERLRTEYPASRYTPDATYRLAEAAFAARDHDRAESLLGALLSGQATDRVRQYARYLQGQIAVTRQDWPKVQEVFETFVREFPESPQRLVAEFWIAESLYRRKQFDAAGKRFEALLGKARGRDDAWLGMIPLRRAQVLAQKQKWVEALAIASKIGEDYPGFEQQFEADYVVGRCLAARADFEGAREALNRVIDSPAARRTETEAMARWMIGETYFHQKNYEAAIREFIALEVLCAFPTWQAAALLEAGKCRELLGEREEALRLYTRIVKRYPDTEAAKLARAKLDAPAPGQSAESG